jgi:hypothetical protein
LVVAVAATAAAKDGFIIPPIPRELSNEPHI